MLHDLRAVLRLAKGKKEQPSAAIFDGRTIQSTPESGERAGYDGHKRRKGSKIHIAVDTLGLLLAGHVTPANEQERAQIKQSCKTLSKLPLSIKAIPVRIPKTLHEKGFVLLPRRWVVERSFAWTVRFRR